MLKWLKQKQPDGQSSPLGVTEKVTDDPLATIQVQPSKNSSSSANKKLTKINGGSEIYAVSRVNPLFEEEDGGGNGGGSKGGISPGNHSGSSGYDSGPSDDDSLNKRTHNYEYIAKNSPLFSGQEDVIVHHEAAITVEGSYLTSNGRPVLQILEQNPNFVKNIVVATTRPLTPIEESLLDGATRKSIPVPTRNAASSTKPGDSLGVAKVLQRNKNYVQSIRIGPGPAAPQVPLEGQLQRRFQNLGGDVPSTSANAVGRKPSVTFAEKVDWVDGKNSTSRRTSADQDSIVTESLLMMTSTNHQQHNNHNNELLLQEVRARRTHHRMKSETDVLAGTSQAQAQIRPDLTDFSNNLLSNKNRITRQTVGTSKGLHPNGGTPGGPANNGSEYEEDEDVIDEDHYNSERSDSSSSSASAKSRTPSSTRNRSISSNSSANKSAFGGIADHYAAAKEIAKEIESYSTGSGKSMGISLVRELLLSNRGRSQSSSTSSSSFTFKQNKDKNQPEVGVTGNRVIGGTGTLVSTVVQVQPQPGEAGFLHHHNNGIAHYKTQNSGDKPWLQHHPQVYVKANSVTASTSKTTTPNHPLGLGHQAQNEGQDQIPIYEILPGAARLRHEDSDSGNSTDRSPKGSGAPEDELEDSEGEAHFDVQTTDPSETPKQISSKSLSKSESSNSSSSTGSNNDKVMIVTGDSQNMVVDLSAVPLDLRDAIISGTALMTFPDGLRLVDPGYTMITIPNDDQHLKSDDYGTKNKAQFWERIQQKHNGSQPGSNKGFRGKDNKQLTGLPFHPNHDSHTTPDFTLDGHRQAIQTRKVKNGKKRRCLCRLCGMIFFLAAFLGVIVALSLIYTNGRKYFGSA